jgi:hypothetical protein
MGLTKHAKPFSLVHQGDSLLPLAILNLVEFGSQFGVSIKAFEGILGKYIGGGASLSRVKVRLGSWPLV